MKKRERERECLSGTALPLLTSVAPFVVNNEGEGGLKKETIFRWSSCREGKKVAYATYAIPEWITCVDTQYSF